jgi:hypothetical protein
MKAKETKKQRLIRILNKNGCKEGIDKMTERELQQKLNQLKKEGKLPKDLRRLNGGERENSGPKEIAKDPIVTEIKYNHAIEEIDVIVTDRKTGQVKSEKKKSLIAMLDMLRQEALKNKNMSAASLWMDRILGRPKQELEHQGGIKTSEQRIPTKAEMMAAQSYAQILKEEMENEK